MKTVEIYTGSSCITRTKSGGWAAILVYGGHEKEIYGSCEYTTNNRMELSAAIEALSTLKEPCEVNLYSSSQYLCDSFRYGRPGYDKHNWKPLDGRPLFLRDITLYENLDLWDKLFALCEIHTMKAVWVQGNSYNMRCRKTAHAESRKLFDAKTAKPKQKKRTPVKIYTDGACIGNPGPGGWGAVLLYNGSEKELSGGDKDTTNNRMELSAVIGALFALKEPCDVTLYSDSKYVCNSLKLGWAKSWKANGWMRKTGPALNPDLWDKLLSLCDVHTVNPIWVKGHSGNKYNERCDKIATRTANRISKT